MKNFFIGFIFVFLDFDLTLGNSVIGFLPNFIGYYFILLGLREFKGNVMNFDKITSITSFMLIYSVITYVIDFLGMNTNIAFALGLVSLLGHLYISYNIVIGVKELEISTICNMNSDLLLSRWKFMAFSNIASILLIFIPVINLITTITALIMGILFLTAFNYSKNAYYAN